MDDQNEAAGSRQIGSPTSAVRSYGDSRMTVAGMAVPGVAGRASSQ